MTSVNIHADCLPRYGLSRHSGGVHTGSISTGRLRSHGQGGFLISQGHPVLFPFTKQTLWKV